MPTEFEKLVIDEYKSQGYTVHTSGWPDMLAVRKRADGSLEVVIREIKGQNDKLHGSQPAILEIFRHFGIDAKVRWESTGEETLGNDPKEYRKVGRPKKAVNWRRGNNGKLYPVEPFDPRAVAWAYGLPIPPKEPDEFEKI